MAVAAAVDLRPGGLLPDVWDQLQLGSCVAHGVGAAYEFDLAKQGGAKNQTPSRLFIYYNNRWLEDSIASDSGSTVADGAKSINKYGAPQESSWGYDIARFAEKPPAQAYTEGLVCVSVKYASVPQSVQSMQAILTSGYPIVIGFTVYESFESSAVAATGVMPMPTAKEGVLGGHCVLVVGYTQIKGAQYWICRNSWGTAWGDHGYFYMPQAYLTNSNLAGDFWVIQSVTSPDPTPTPPAPIPVPPTPTPTPVPPAPPTPTPTPDPNSAADLAFAAVGNRWERTIMSRHITDAIKMKTAFDLWKRAKGY